MASETLQLGLIALTSAPVIQTVFQQFQSEPNKPEIGNTDAQVKSEREPEFKGVQPDNSNSSSKSDNSARESPSTVSRTIASEQALTSNMSAASPPPVILAPPLTVTDERTLFIQNALHSGNFHSASAVSPISPQIEKPSGIEEPQTAPLEKDTARSPFDSQTNKENTQETEAEPKPNEMGLLSVITGNISPPADMPTSAHRDGSNGHGIISNDIQANTVGPTTHRSMVRSDTVRSGMTDGTTGPVPGSHGGGIGVGHTGVEHDRSITPTRDQERSVTPTPLSAGSTEQRTGPIPGATGDGYSPLPVVHTTGDRISGGEDVPAPLGAGDRAEVQTEGGIEKGVPAHVGADGVYEGVGGKSSEGNLSRPPLGDDQPSRSYIKRPDSVIGTGNNTTTNGSIREGGSTLSHPPRSVDYATASPANLGHPEKEVISLPAGGALHQDGAQSHTGDGQLSDGERREREQQAEIEREQQQQQPEIRQQLNEGQAYRADGSVPDQPQQQQQHQYGQYAAPAAGVAAVGAASYGLQQHHHQQQQQMYQQQQQPQMGQGYNQQPQHMNDQSFAAERAMSPGPNQMFSAVPSHMQQGHQQRDDPSSQMSRLSFQDPAHQQQQQQQYPQQHGHMNGVALAQPAIGGAGVGPSPGPPVSAFAPTSATSPARRTPEPRGSTEVGVTGLARNSTMRSTATGGGLSRGSTLRRGGAFANGAALQGGGVGETFGRDDIHARTSGADRSLMGAGTAGQAGMHRISKDEARDAKRLSKMIKVEGKTEAAAVKGAIKELEALQKVQRAAHAEELKAQQKHAKFTRVEHKARLRFLKEKERYERVEAQLRSIEADYEAKREHASQQTDLLAEKTQELNDLRAQKAADDRERELKLLSLKNPGHA